MKKLLALLLSVVMVASFAACTNAQSSDGSQNTQATQAATLNNEDVNADLPDTDVLEWVDFAQYNLDETAQVKNIILMIGDGMGENIIKASEIVKGDKLVMSGLPHQTHVTTYSQSVTDGLAEYTDSAASATALSTGVKTYNKYIGVDKDGNKLETICEFAKGLGMKTGLVDRHYVCHATPAGMAAHTDNRDNYPEIIKEMLASEIDVMFGGGAQHYKDIKSVQRTASKHSYKFIDNEEDLLSATASDGRLLGLFAYANMDRASMTPSLTTMTSKALDLLDNDKGFFLMVEGSNIDVFESAQDMTSTLEQMQSFDKTVDLVLKWAEKHPGTLVLVTADHETGGVVIPENATAKDINDSCFTSGGEHTNTDVLLMAGGAQSAEICKPDLIDNTDIAKYMRSVLSKE